MRGSRDLRPHDLRLAGSAGRDASSIARMRSITRATGSEYVVELLGVGPSGLLTRSVNSQFDKDFGYFRAGFVPGGRSV